MLPSHLGTLPCHLIYQHKFPDLIKQVPQSRYLSALFSDWWPVGLVFKQGSISWFENHTTTHLPTPGIDYNPPVPSRETLIFTPFAHFLPSFSPYHACISLFYFAVVHYLPLILIFFSCFSPYFFSPFPYFPMYRPLYWSERSGDADIYCAGLLMSKDREILELKSNIAELLAVMPGLGSQNQVQLPPP